MHKHPPIIRQLMRGWQQPGWLNFLLLPLSWLNACVMGLRRRLYDRRILKSTEVGVPVIVVGNLSVGGTGKSPLVLALAEYLAQQGWHPGIISRGYGGEGLEYPALVNDRHGAFQVGDEAMMMYQANVAPIAVGPDRSASCDLLVAGQDCDIIVSDDGFQHLQLKRDIDIVVVDGERGFGNGWCLPAGPLREPRSALSRASMLVVNCGQDHGAANPRIQTGYDSPVPVYRMHIATRPVYALVDRSRTASLQEFVGERVHAIAGLGNPRRFFETLESAGLDIEPHGFSDHHRFRESDFAMAEGGQAVILTEKDAVKCRQLIGANGLSPELAGRIWVLPVAAVPEAGFHTAIDQLLNNLQPAR